MKSINKDKDGHATIYSIMQNYSRIRSDLYRIILSVSGTVFFTIFFLGYVIVSLVCLFIYLSLNGKFSKKNV